MMEKQVGQSWRKNAKVVVVGGGPAGLGCAGYLNLHGITDVMVLEASPEFGGRCKTERSSDGSFIDPSAQYLGERQRPFWWAEKLGVPVVAVEDTKDLVFVDGQRASDAVADDILEQMDKDYDLLIQCSGQVNASAPWETTEINLVVGSGKAERSLMLPVGKMSALELYQALPMSSEGRAAITAFEVGTQGVPLEQLSAVMHLAQYVTQGATGADDYVFENGYGSLLDAMVDFVGPSRCFANTAVVKVEHLTDRRHVVHCADGRTVTAEIVVFAIPPKVRPHIDSPFLANRYEVQVGGAAKISALSEVEPDHTWALDLTNGCLGQESWAFPSGKRHGLYVFGSGKSLDDFAGLNRISQGAVATERFGQVFYADSAVPKGLQISFTDWTKVPFVGGSYTVPSPQDVLTLRDHCLSNSPSHGVFVIGEDSGPGYSGANFGYSDGAFEAAQIAAKQIFTLLS